MRIFHFVLGLAVLGLLVPNSFSDKANKKKDPPKATKVVKAGDVMGQVLKIDDELTLRVPIKQLDPKKVNDNLVWWQRKQLDLMRVNDPIQRQQQLAQAMAEYQRRQFNVFKDGHVDVAIDFADDTKFRVMNPPDKFDDKGNPAAYTAKELKELKGTDSKLAGYQAELGDVKRGQYVVATLANAPKKKDDKSDKESDKKDDKKGDKKGKKGDGKKERGDDVQDVPYVVKVVYIYGEPAK